jgi:hypothetical protein
MVWNTLFVAQINFDEVLENPKAQKNLFLKKEGYINLIYP